MNKTKSWTVILTSISMVFGTVAFAEQNEKDLSTRMDVLERTVNSMHKSFLNAFDGNKNPNSNDTTKVLNELTEEIKILRGDVEKLEMKIKKYSYDFQGFQDSVETKLNNIKKNSINDDKSNMKDSYIISNISNEIENNTISSSVENSSYNKVENNVKNDNKAALEYQNAYLLLKKKDDAGKIQYDKAQKAFERFISVYPQNPLIGNAHYWIASIYVQEKNYSKAAIEFLSGYKANPKSGRAIDNLLGLADSLFKIGRSKETCSTLNKLFDEFPNLNSENKRATDDLFKNAGCKN